MNVKTAADIVSASATAVIALTGLGALYYAHRQLSQSRETERVKHLVDFEHKFDSEPMTTWRKLVAEQRLKGVDYPDEATRLLDFFETVGLLVRRGYLDADDVWGTFSYWIFNIYADFRDDIEQMQRDDSSVYSDFCELREQLRKIEEDSGTSDDRPSKEEIKEFWEDEKKIIPGTPARKRKRKSPNVAS